MTDTITVSDVPHEIINSGYHAPLNTIDAYLSTIPALALARYSDTLSNWAHSAGRTREQTRLPLIVRMINDPQSIVRDRDTEQHRLFAGALHTLVERHGRALFGHLVVPSGDTVHIPTVAEIRADHSTALAPHADLVRAWGINQPRLWLEWFITHNRNDAGHLMYEREFSRPNATWQQDVDSVHAYLTEHLTTTETTMTDTTTTPAVIGPDTPGWDAFWERVRGYAEEDGYEEQYNKLAEAFGAATITDTRAEEITVNLEVRVDSFYVTVQQTMTRGEYEDEEYEVSQTEVDDAIREYISNDNVDYGIQGAEEV